MNYTDHTDKQLLDAYDNGDMDAMGALVERHRDRVFNYIHTMVKDRDVAEDIFQENFIRAINFIDEGRYTDNGKFVSWVISIARNQIADHFRQKSARYKHISIADSVDILNDYRFSDLNAEQLMEKNQMEETLRKLISKLPEEQRQIVNMRYYNNMSFKEISEKTSVSINTSLGRMRYALINLRKIIEGLF